MKAAGRVCLALQSDAQAGSPRTGQSISNTELRSRVDPAKSRDRIDPPARGSVAQTMSGNWREKSPAETGLSSMVSHFTAPPYRRADLAQTRPIATGLSDARGRLPTSRLLAQENAPPKRGQVLHMSVYEGRSSVHVCLRGVGGLSLSRPRGRAQGGRSHRPRFKDLRDILMSRRAAAG